MEADAIPARTSSEDAAGGEAFLEKMLKDAKELSMKIKSNGGDIIASDAKSVGSDHSGSTMPKENTDPMLDPLLARADQMVREMKRAAQIMIDSDDDDDNNTSSQENTDGANKTEKEPKAKSSPQKTLLKEAYTDLDEVLRQSEHLMKQLRSPKGSQTDAASVTPNETMPTVRTPSSVYVPQSSNLVDDVSSVGSGSLRASGTLSNSENRNMSEALDMSKMMEDALLSSIPEPPPSSSSSNLRRIDSSDLFTGEEKDARDNSNKDANEESSYQASVTGFMSASKLITDAVNDNHGEEKVTDHPPQSPSRSVIPDQTSDDYVPVMDFSPSRSRRNFVPPPSPGGPYRVQQKPIPDFTKDTGEAKWEKVESATKGDDDYVPLVDYSKSPTSSTPQKSSKNTSSSNSNLNRAPSGRQSKLEAYRRKERIRKKRRNRLIAAAITSIAVVYFLFQLGASWNQPSSSPAVVTTTPIEQRHQGDVHITEEEVSENEQESVVIDDEEVAVEESLEVEVEDLNEFVEDIEMDTLGDEDEEEGTQEEETQEEVEGRGETQEEVEEPDETIGAQEDETDDSSTSLSDGSADHEIQYFPDDTKTTGVVGKSISRLTRFARACFAFILAFFGGGR